MEIYFGAIQMAMLILLALGIWLMSQLLVVYKRDSAREDIARLNEEHREREEFNDSWWRGDQHV